MKKILLMIGRIFYSVSSFSDEISLTSDLWCPYACDPKSANPGFMVEIAKVIFENAGHKVNYNIVNWARGISETRVGKYNGIIAASKTDAPDFIMPTMAAGHSSNFFWINKDNNWVYKNLDSLKGRKIGVINSYSYGEEVDLPVQNKNPSYLIVSGDDALAKMVRMTDGKRLDGFVENPFVLSYLLKDMSEYKDKFKSASLNITKDTELFVAFSPQNPKSKQYAEIMSKGMSELRKSGKLKVILSKYGLKDWK
jgi:polar amino acid transport system substrate-binding protein